MHELLQFLAIFAGIYLFDCVHWARRGTLGLRAWWWRRVRVVHGGAMPGNESFGIAIAQPLPPFGRLFLTESLPVSITRDVVVSFVSAVENPGTRPPQVERVVTLNSRFVVTSEARRVLVDGKRFVDAGSTRLAGRIAAFMRELRDLEATRRERRIDEWLRSSLDAQAASERVREFEHASVHLRFVCGAQVLLVFAVTPVVGTTFGLISTWIPLLATLVVLQVLITWSFVRAHRRLHPAAKRARRSESVMIALSPPVAMRAFDALSRDLLAEFHPLAAAHALLPRAEFEAEVESALRDASFPLPMIREGSDPVVRTAAEAFLERTRAALEDFAGRCGVPEARWKEAPPRVDLECTAYCPRCAQQFTRTGGTCARCSELPLISF